MIKKKKKSYVLSRAEGVEGREKEREITEVKCCALTEESWFWS